MLKFIYSANRALVVLTPEVNYKLVIIRRSRLCV